MSIFSRLGEMINANITTMLERAENPLKTVRLMIHEMEDILTEVKSSAAEVIAARIRLERQMTQLEQKAAEWQTYAELAVTKNRDDLAREALEQKRRYDAEIGVHNNRLKQIKTLVNQHQQDIAKLEKQLEQAQTRKRALTAKLRRAKQRQQVEESRYQSNSQQVSASFERWRRHFDQHKDPDDGGDALDQKFRDLERDDRVQSELDRLKQHARRRKK